MPSKAVSRLCLFALFPAFPALLAAGVPALDALPDGLPENYRLRDWRQTAIDLDALLFNAPAPGGGPALYWVDDSHINVARDGIALPAYAGDFRQTPARKTAYDGITVLGSVLGATLAGVDKSAGGGRDQVAALSTLYRSADGTDLYLNAPGARTGASYWYELLPSLLFFQIHSLYPGNAEHRAQLRAIAERWHGGLLALCGGDFSNGPDFDHTALDLATLRSRDDKWREPDAAAGVAFLEYIAGVVTGDARFAAAADAALRYLDGLSRNPLYEILLPYGAYAAARANAETGAAHDAAKLLNWCFDATNPRRWGMLNAAWGGTPVHGLIGATNAGHEYAFAMNTFLTAALAVPAARYDDRLSEPVAKWLLHAAANARYFYADAWPAGRQTSFEWSRKNDPKTALAYEGLRKDARVRARPEAVKTLHAAAVKPVRPGDHDRFSLTLVPEGGGAFSHIWRFTLPKGNGAADAHTFAVILDAGKHPRAPYPLELRTARNPGGPWTLRKTVKAGGANRLWFNAGMDGDVFLRLDARGAAPLHLKEAYADTRLPFSPLAGGDAIFHGWGRTDLALYGSVFAGVFGALVAPTDVEGVLLVNLNATEVFPARAWPTRLLRNPHAVEKTVTVPLVPARAAAGCRPGREPEGTGGEAVTLYDAVANKVVAANVSGTSCRVTLGPRQTMQLVVMPAGGALSRAGGKLFCDGVVADHRVE
ncbi:MAG: hypothetical protein LBR12_05865 [Opitutaceae bacterium]|jgi:hypothetical protein|nr:hypothetical protein [Opitutaceae bacterium]